ncbi:MAG: transporter permease [Caulobacteraceae bacterium]|nr:transporter permease [Caulobacteraceae bacterium]
MSDGFDVASWRPGPLLPRGDRRDNALLAAIIILTALACMAALSALAADRAARGWIGQLSGAATVIVRPAGADTPDQAAAKAAEALAAYPGVVEARAMSAAEINALLAPWLGKATDLADLPTPRLVDLRLDVRHPPEAAGMQKVLTDMGLDATVDDHRAWTASIEATAEVARWSAVAVCALVAACAAAMITFATRAGLESRQEMIEVLHLTGARDNHIADVFAGRAALRAFQAAIVGAATAALAAVAIRLAGGQAGLISFLPFAWIDLLTLLAAPPIVAALAALAARSTARRLIGAMP